MDPHWAERGKVIEQLQSRVAKDPGDERFFSRPVELGALLARLAGPPALVTVVIGPTDCGKSRLLKRLKKTWCSDEELASTSPVFYFDLRVELWSTPEDAAVCIHRKVDPWSKVFQVKNGLAGVVGVDVAHRVAKLLPNVHTGSVTPNDLAKAMESMWEAMQPSEGTVTYPIFIVDEADRLKHGDKKDLATLSGFFKSKRAYLILSTSDDLFRTWLGDMFDDGEWEAFGVGYFPSAQAREFFLGYSLPAAPAQGGQSFQDSDWDDVYAVCGGSPLLLNHCARSATLNRITWKEAALCIMSSSLYNVQMGLAASRADMGFSSARV